MSGALPRSSLQRLGALLRAERLARGLSLRELSARTGVSNAHLSGIERGLHEPSLSVLRAIASALDRPLGTILIGAGVLDDSDPTEHVRDTEAAIEHDPALSEAQRFALLSVYRSFVPGPPRSTPRPPRSA